jgi:alpha-ketoglutarate-dependent taurine dioxygenase
MAVVGEPAGVPYALVEPEGEQRLADLSHESIEALLKARGAVLIRGFPADVDDFRRFSDPFCSQWVINESRNRDMIDPDHVIQSVDRGQSVFSLHSEVSRSPWRPDICFFYCIQPPRSGGETTICDGVALAKALPEAVREGLTGQRFVYSQRVGRKHLAFWLGTETPTRAQLMAPPPGCPFHFFPAKSGVYAIFTRPALHRPMFSDELAFANFLLFARDMHGTDDFPTMGGGGLVPEEWVDAIRETSARLTTPVTWQAGDLLILDNSRFMHGRAAIEDPAERIIASRFGYLKDAPVNPEEPADPLWRRAPFSPPVVEGRRGK